MRNAFRVTLGKCTNNINEMPDAIHQMQSDK